MTLMHVCTLVGLHSERHPQLVWPTHPASRRAVFQPPFRDVWLSASPLTLRGSAICLSPLKFDPPMKIHGSRFPGQVTGQLEAGGNVSVRTYQQLTQTMSLGCDSKIHEKLTKGT